MTKFIKIGLQTCFITAFYFFGQFIQVKLHLTIPGSIIGLLLLFILLSSKLLPEKYIDTGANFLLSLMMLFLVPATVGVMNYFQIFQGKGLLLVFSLIISSCLVFIGSGFICEKWGKSPVGEKEKNTA